MEKINRRIYICLAIALIIINIVLFVVYKEGYFKTPLLPILICTEGLLFVRFFCNHVIILLAQSSQNEKNKKIAHKDLTHTLES